MNRIGSEGAYISGFYGLLKERMKLPGCAGIWKCSQCYEKYRQWGYVMDRPSEMQQTIEMHLNMGTGF